MVHDGLAGGQRFELGRVISTSIAVFARNLGPFAVITFLIGIPYILISLWSVSSASELQAAAQTGELPAGFIGMAGVGFLIFLLTNTLAQSAITYGTVQDLRDQRTSFGDALGRGLTMLPRVIVAAILASIGIAIGFALLFIPGLILVLMWWVFVPVIVVEGVGVIEAFGRSRGLTRGHRWGILGLLVIVGIAQSIVALLAGLIGNLFGPMAAEILNTLVALFFTAFSSVLAAVGYYFLRAEKEGVVIDDIARVFD
jgi:hypothetical protein